MSNKKMSYVVAVENAINGELTPEVVDRLNDLKASLEKRNARKSTEPTKAQKANAELVEKIFEAMEPNMVYMTADIGGLVPELEGASSQKISALMKKLVIADRVKAAKVKGKATYTLA
jgi:hypothetical protein